VRFTVRDHRPEDFTTLWEIDQACFLPGIAYSQSELKTYMRRWGSFTLVAEAAADNQSNRAMAQIMGFLVAESGRRGVGHIITIDVRPETRQSGVGSALLVAAEARLRAAKNSAVRLETAVDNASALAFYKHHRYDVIETVPRYYSNGVDALVLKKNLFPSVSST